MLSLPDFIEKKILVVPIEEKLESQLKLQVGNIVLMKEGKVIDKVSCHIVFCMVIIGDCSITTKLIRELQSYGISVFLLNRSFKFITSMHAHAEGNYQLREKQYFLDKDTELLLSKQFVQNKIDNQWGILQKTGRLDLEQAYRDTTEKVTLANSIDSLRGLEGSFASRYFSGIFDEIGWLRRAPRTKEDIANVLLDIGYTFVFNYVDALLRLFGFDTYKGVYHQLFFQRQSLSCDLMEPMRPMIDYQLRKSFNLGQIQEKDFVFKNESFRFKDYSVSGSYSNIWFDLIMKKREDMYQFIFGYYRCFQNPEKYEYAQFKV